MKISIIGAGRVGSQIAFVLMERGLCDEIVIIDIIKDRAQGEALDLLHCSSEIDKKIKISGGDDYSLVNGSEIIIITAGVARKPGDTRLDLAKKNSQIMQDIVRRLPKEGLILVVSNPVDVMTYQVLKSTNKDKTEVFGLGTMLDTMRLRSLLLEKYGKCDEVYIIGEHGDSMIPVFGKLAERGNMNELKSVFENVRKGAAEVIKLKGATVFAPAVAVAKVVQSVVRDERKILPISALREEYGVCISLPTIIGKKGANFIDFELNEEEKDGLLKSVEVLKKAKEQLHL
jgi:malate/lactate dehydrogenase